ncbi:MAG: type II toxin-antitoxin system CcdA family antitoxin [Fimbriimonadaceae bacterium]|nr:type II toxin-antitoxin system CcdA family antitoxin [Fimbriimonadaceae bacterium]
MKNVTVTLEEDLLRRARIESASRGISLSAFVRGAVSDAIVQSDQRGRAMTQAAIEELFEFVQKVGKTMDGPPMTRDEAHER